MRHPIPTPIDCQAASDEFRGYLEGSMTQKEALSLEHHLDACPGCQKALDEYSKMFSEMDEALGARPLGEDFLIRSEARLKRTPEGVMLPIMATSESSRLSAAAPGAWADASPELDGENFEPHEGFFESMNRQLGAAPWWVISGTFHALVLLLVTLIGLAVLKGQETSVVIVTDLQSKEEPEEEKKVVKRDIMKQPIDVKDVQEVQESNIVTHEEIEVADVAETADDSDTVDTFGENGASDIWLGGSGTVGSIGVGGGGSAGAFGRPNGAGGRMRRALSGGGSKETESAVERALDWLARNQEADGGWDAIKHEGRQDDRVTGINGNAAVTGYALLAFMGAGNTDRIGKYKDHVKRGLEWMVRKLEEHEKAAGEGRYCKNMGSNYTQGVAALALAEAAAMCRDPNLKAAAQRAINGVVAGQIKDGQSEYQAWDYAPGGRTNDTSVTGWNVMALKSAKVAGLQVDPAAFEGAMRWINASQELGDAPRGGDGEYWEGGMMHYRGTLAAPKSRTNMAMTSAAALTRLLVGGEDPGSPGVAGPCNLMKNPAHLPAEKESHFNLYYWYYGTLCMFQKGGGHWKIWNEAMKPTLINTQRRDGKFDGSWNPYFDEPQGHIYGGRVMSTALGAMCLEVYYRYLPIYR